MVLQMTRQEYADAYGSAPSAPTIPNINIDTTPVRMTRAEYESLYGQKVEKKRGAFSKVIDFQKENLKGLVASYPEYIKSVTEEVKQSAEDIKGDVFKPGYKSQAKTAGRLLKTGARVAGDTAGAVFAPIGAAIGATGFGKLTDWVANKVVDSKAGEALTDARWFQDFAVTHPNADKDFERAILLMFARAEKGKIDPKTVAERTKKQAADVGTAVKKIPEKIEARKSNKASSKIENEISGIESNYAGTRKANEYSYDGGKASRKRISQTDVLNDVVNKDGIIRTKDKGGAVDQYRALTLDGAEGVVRKNLVREGAKVNIGEVANELTLQVYRSGLEGADLVSAIKGIKKELAGLKLRADELGNIELYKIHNAKISATDNINYQTDAKPTVKFRKAKAKTYKNIVENKSKLSVDVNGKKYGVKEINKELSKYLKDIERLERLDGKRVKGGKLGKYSAQVTGNIIGGLAGATGGFAGAAIGSAIGGEASAFLKGRAMSKTFGNKKAQKAGDVVNEAIARATKEGGKPPKVDLKTPDVKVGVPKDIPKTKEILKTERDIADNVKQQKKYIKAGDFGVVAVLKEVYEVLVNHLKKLVNDVRKNTGGYARLPGAKDKLRNRKQGGTFQSVDDIAKLQVEKGARAKDFNTGVPKKSGLVSEPPKAKATPKIATDIQKAKKAGKSFDDKLKNTFQPIKNVEGGHLEGKNQAWFVTSDGKIMSVRKKGGGIAKVHDETLKSLGIDVNKALESGLLRIRASVRGGAKELFIEGKVMLNNKQISAIQEVYPDYKIFIDITKIGEGTNATPIKSFVIERGSLLKNKLK